MPKERFSSAGGVPPLRRHARFDMREPTPTPDRNAAKAIFGIFAKIKDMALHAPAISADKSAGKSSLAGLAMSSQLVIASAVKEGRPLEVNGEFLVISGGLEKPQQRFTLRDISPEGCPEGSLLSLVDCRNVTETESPKVYLIGETIVQVSEAAMKSKKQGEPFTSKDFAPVTDMKEVDKIINELLDFTGENKLPVDSNEDPASILHRSDFAPAA